jgi:SAM-dependent methyltransferase
MTTVTRLGPYPLDNDDEDAYQHHKLLATLLDKLTRDTMFALVSEQRKTGLAGVRCLEIGAGGGSIARWLAGKMALVTATDVKPHFIPASPRLSVRTHNLNSDDPLPAGPFDLIHARLVLSHLPKRREILKRLVDRLALGGTLLVGDWRTANPDPVVTAPSDVDAELYRKFQKTLSEKVFAAWGTSREWAAEAFSAFREAGLEDVQTRVEASYWPGGETGCRFVGTVLRQLRVSLLDNGMTEFELEQIEALLQNPAFVVHGHPMYYTSGHRR